MGRTPRTRQPTKRKPAIETPELFTEEARFFLEPGNPQQRQYEALRKFFVEGVPSGEAARSYGYSPGSFRVLCWRFRHGELEKDFFLTRTPGPKNTPKKDAVRERVITLRKRNLSIYDIRDELERNGPGQLSATAIQEVLREEGFQRLPRRADEERPAQTRPTKDVVADVRQFSLADRTFTTHAGGLFLLLPLLVKLDLDSLVTSCGFPGSKMLPATHAVRAGLLLKLLGKSRRSHVMDLLFDQGVALAVGLNALPKSTFMWQYSSRLGRKSLGNLMGQWVDRLQREELVDSSSFNLDFHAIPYFGEDEFVEKHYVPRRSQRRKAILAFFAQDASRQVFCYSNASIRKGEEASEVLRFVEFWAQKTGRQPRHLVFDSKLTTQATLSQLNQRGITFLTLRGRHPALTEELRAQPRTAWQRIQLKIPGRKYQTPRVIDQRITLSSYEGPLRQLLVRDLGHDLPTVLLTNDWKSSPAALLTRYARRMLIENTLSEAVGFFHLDALSSAVALNVDFDVLLTVLASGVYRLFAKTLHGYEHAQARQLFRRFLDTSARLTITPEEVTVVLPRRSHNPLLLDGGFIGTSTPIPWWQGRPLRILVA